MKWFLGVWICCMLLSCHTDHNAVKETKFLHENWRFAEEGRENWYPAHVPGVVHLDLLDNQLIEDPYWEDNELKQRWIEQKNWVYKMQFSLEEQTLRSEHIELVFEGLDTYADVFLNDKKILHSTNMFRSWREEVKPFLEQGSNELRVVFYSPVLYNKNKVNNYPYELPSGNEAADIPVKVSAYTRKAAYQFGWDWAPRLVSAGIWRPVKLVTWNKARIINVFTSTLALSEEKAQMQTEIEVEAGTPGVYELVIGEERILRELDMGITKVIHAFEINQPRLWWANGMGDPHRYEQKLELFANGERIDSTTNKFGIRTIELIHESDPIGTAFYFKLNGKPVFMKGGNYVPQDVFLPRVSREQYHRLIASVKEANMNMVRVWGGGIYEEDLFYDLCDEHGILIWQDFMFAGSMYPGESVFRDNVKAEVTENIKRLRQHPSLALWCGNNEIEVAWKNWGWQKQYGYTEEDSTQIWDAYTALFHDLLPDLVRVYDPQRAYTPTSPLSNWGTAENFNHGSMHYWGVWHGKEPFEAFSKNVGRFMVEYGFQSFPDITTLEKVISDSNLYLNSPMIKHRQKSYIGNGLILRHIRQYGEEPTSFQAFVQLSQEAQARAMQLAIRAHLSQQPHCMGSLFWQLNDCWPGPSWSVIDYYGNRKVAYETVKEEFSR